MSRKIRVLHLEPTDVCQAACPLCARETDTAFDRTTQHHLTIEQIMQHISITDIQHLDKMFMCGNYGDPAAGQHTLDIYRQFRHLNPDIVLGMNTNGGLQNQDWWQDLAKLFQNPGDYVVFSIDGLGDTNHQYRVNVNWSRVMQNASSFIRAGGSAHWDMLVYEHNQHQVADCERLARDMGFRWFRTKVSKRPLIATLRPPHEWQPSRPLPPIRCHALQECSIYMDSRGRIYPCCWLGHRQSTVRDIGEVEPTWHTDSPNATCLQTCGTVEQSTGFQNQWRRLVELIN